MPLGRTSIDPLCLPCTPGSYSGAGAASCDACPLGLSSPERAVSADECTNCTMGEYVSEGGQCVACPPVEYVNRRAQPVPSGCEFMLSAAAARPAAGVWAAWVPLLVSLLIVVFVPGRGGRGGGGRGQRSGRYAECGECG